MELPETAPNAAPRPSVPVGLTTLAKRVLSTHLSLGPGTYNSELVLFIPYPSWANLDCAAHTSPPLERRKSSPAPASPHPRKPARPSSTPVVVSATSSPCHPTNLQPWNPTSRTTSQATRPHNITTPRPCEATPTYPPTAQTTPSQSTVVSA